MQYKRPTFPTMHQGYIIYNKDGQSDFFLFGFKLLLFSLILLKFPI